MSTKMLAFRSSRSRTLGLAVAAVIGAHEAIAAPASLFERFVGNWSGGGQIVASNGHRESIRCRANYAEAKDGSALSQGIVCASESFKLDIRTYAEATGDEVQGHWSESTRDVGGQLTGRIAPGRFVGEIVAPAFTAAVSLISNGRSQEVSIQPRGGDISDVRIELKRNG